MRSRFISIGIMVVLLGIVVWYVASNWQEFSELAIAQPLLFLPLLILTLANIYSVGMVMELAIEPHGVKLGKNEMFGLSSINRFSNNVAPGYLGIAVRAMYLKRSHGVSIAKTSASFLISNFLQFLISGLLAIVVYILHANFTVGDTPTPIIVVVAALVCFLLVLFVPFGVLQTMFAKIRTKRDNRILEALSDVLDSYIQVRSHPGMIQKLALWTLTTVLLSVLTVMVLYYIIGLEISFISAAFITALGSWGIIFSITPANVGIREGLMVFGAQIMDVPIPETLAMAILLRLTTLGVAATLSVYYAPKLLQVSLPHIFSLKRR